MDHLTSLARLHTRRLSFIMATVLDPAVPLDVPFGKDPDYTNLGFRASVDQHLHQLLKELHPGYVPVGRREHSRAADSAVTLVTYLLKTREPSHPWRCHHHRRQVSSRVPVTVTVAF
ncbi:unnamed protein product [[Actinomadura] parvosata subsp. kistnae]|uniref:Uncharacterized protein n=1 Tax=[Actinomadura] parvosata subsp. kistnae TaxID=1909395 RepID=A0A1U9ZX75_9ACTN|nr:hypothetical protein [Nonomuraea sp. ATCC 55076]AQZ62542.1 hypothetical protein BKM31_14705 [Nonomuraea sp. ATCC 55076]SPL88808.1 unnamed protein product [Actinomadura parvosata subsp. kistnae]